MTVILEGVYKEGKIELVEKPEGLPEGRVRVIVISEAAPRPAPQYLVFGKYRGDRDIPLEAFKDAEWRGEPEFDDLYGR